MPVQLVVQKDGNILVQVLPGQRFAEPGVGAVTQYEVIGLTPAMAQHYIQSGVVRALATLAEAVPKPPPPAEDNGHAPVPMTPSGEILVDQLPRLANGLVLLKLLRKTIAANTLGNVGEHLAYSPTVAADLIANGYGIPVATPPPTPKESPQPARILVKMVASYRPLSGSAFHRGEVAGFPADEAERLIQAGAAVPVEP